MEYNENKLKGHKMIFKIYREQLTDFVPKFKLRRTKTKAPVEESKT